MWVITTGGFVSAVEHRDNKDLVMVRARDEQSLKTMIEGIELAGKAINAEGEKFTIEKDLEPISSDTADYRWRVTVSKATFALWLQFEVLNFLNYPNFKSALAKHRGNDFTRAAHRVWDDMQLVSDGPQVYGSVGVGGTRIASKYSNYGSSYGTGSYAGGIGGAGKKVGSSFFSDGVGSEDDKRDWDNGYHGFNDHGAGLDDGIDDADFVGEDVPELPEGADSWTDEQFEKWLEDAYKPMALETSKEEHEALVAEGDVAVAEPVLNFEEAKAELKAISSKPTFQAKKSKYAAKKSDR